MQWLVSLLQAAGAHHTGAAAAPGAEVLAQIASLQERLSDLQDEVTMLRAIIGRSGLPAPDNPGCVHGMPTAAEYDECGTIGDNWDEWQPPSTEPTTSPLLPASAGQQHVPDSGYVDDDAMDTSTYPAAADAVSHPRHGLPGLLPVGAQSAQSAQAALHAGAMRFSQASAFPVHMAHHPDDAPPAGASTGVPPHLRVDVAVLHQRLS